MTSFARMREGRLTILCGVLVAALGLGVGLVVMGPALAAVVPGIIAALAILTRPILGLVVLLLPVPFEDAVVLGQIGTLTKLIGVAVAGLWFARKVLRGDSWRDVVSLPLIILGVLFVALAGTSVIWAEYPQEFSRGIFRLVMALAFALLVIDIVREWKHLDWLLRALVVGGIVAAVLVLNQYYGLGARRAGDAVAGGVNATALMLVSLLPFGFLMARSSESVLWRLTGLGYVLLALIALAVTFSRMSFVLVPVVLGAEAWTTFRGGRGRALLLVVALLGILGVTRFVPLDAVTERISTIGPYIENTFGLDEPGGQPYMSGRGYHLYVAFRIFQDHPALGVGYGNYGEQFLRYQLQVPGSDRFYTSPRSSHSSFAGILAELGLVGLILWLALLTSSAYALVVAWKRTRSNPTSHAFLTVNAVAISFVLMLAYGFYAEMQNEKIFWLILAFTVVVSRLTRHDRRTDPPGQHAETHRPADGRAVAPVGPRMRRDQVDRVTIKAPPP